MKIAVVGLGYVGLAVLANLLENGYEVIGFDTDSYKVAALNDGKILISEPKIEKVLQKYLEHVTFTTRPSELTKASIIYICVNTPEKPDWSVELKYFNEAKDSVLKYSDHETLVIIKSTIPVGTSRKMQHEIDVKRPTGRIRVVFSPEFLRQGYALDDVRNPSRLVFGGEFDEALKIKLSTINPVNQNKIIFTDYESAELSKYSSNNFLALKISYINEISMLANKVGANVDDIKKIMALDPRISDGCLNAGVGFGGGCFVKDTKALYQQAKALGVDAKIIKASIDRNTEQNRILLTKLDEIYKGFKKIKNESILIVGLSFKGNCGDVRGSIAIDNLRVMERQCNNISLYDPLVNKETLKSLDHKIFTSLEEAINNNKIILIFTERTEINKLDDELFEKKIVLDGRGILEQSKIKECAYYYSPILGEIKKR